VNEVTRDISRRQRKRTRGAQTSKGSYFGMEGGAGLLVNIAADYENEFNEWYDKSGVPGRVLPPPFQGAWLESLDQPRAERSSRRSGNLAQQRFRGNLL